MRNTGEQPLIRIVKRDGMKKTFVFLLYFISVVIALGAGAVLLISLDAEPVEYYKQMITMGTVGNRFAYLQYENYIREFVPLLLTSLALSLAFRMKFWNIGGEGQFILGAIAGASVAFLMPSSVNQYATVLFMAVAGGIAGGLIGLLTAVLKVKFGTNETLFTLMLNYIALYLLKYFGETKAGWNIFLRKDSPRPIFGKIPENAYMPVLKIGEFSLSISLIFALLLVAFLFVYLTKTKHGYEIAVVGDSLNTAKYAGMKVNKIICRTMFLSAFLIGAAGGLHVSSAQSLSTSITNNVGWTGIIVAWLAKLNPIGIVVVSALITVLRFGCTVASVSARNIDSHFADLIQGIVLFIILAADFFIRFKIVFRFQQKNSDGEGKA